ncbi:MAG: PQQ-dependent sugar dehydrogenase [Oceanicaulis sp.]
MARRVQAIVTAALAAGCSTGLAGCGSEAGPDPAPAASGDLFAVEEIAGGLSHPWDIAFLPGGDMLVTERTGALRLIEDGVLADEPVAGVPDVYAESQAGLFDVLVSPDFAQTGRVYLSYAVGEADANSTQVWRARLEDGALVDGARIFTADPLRDTFNHFGGRMSFLPDGTIALTLGDAFAYREQAQIRENHLGAVVRFNPDGSIPADNPFAEDGAPAGYVLSYGHRNVQGIAWDPQREVLWTHEHGPEGGDELNVIVAGANYGWPVVTEGIDYNGARITPLTDHAANGFEPPAYGWTPSIAPGGLAWYSGAGVEDWAGDLFVAALSGRALHHLDLDAEGAVVGEQRLLTELEARIRQVAEGPDGALYVLTDGAGDGKVLRVTPTGARLRRETPL